MAWFSLATAAASAGDAAAGCRVASSVAWAASVSSITIRPHSSMNAVRPSSEVSSVGM